MNNKGCFRIYNIFALNIASSLMIKHADIFNRKNLYFESFYS